MRTSSQYLVPPGPPPPAQSLADKRSKTLRRLLNGYSSLDVDTIIEPLSADFTHEVLPASLGMPVRGKADFAHHASMVFSAFKSFEMRPTQLWEDPERGEVILRCAMEGVLKPKGEETDGGKGEGSETKEQGQEGNEEIEKTQVDAHVEVDDESDSSSDEDLDEDLDSGPRPITAPPSTPYTHPAVLSPITEVTEPTPELPPLDLSQLSSSLEELAHLPFPPSTPASRSASPSPPAQDEDKPQQDTPESVEPSEIDTDLHWHNECLLIVSFTSDGSHVLKIQEFVDSHKAVEMKKKHAPKGFDEASAPPPPTYKPAAYLDLDTLKLKDVGQQASVTVTEVPPSPLPSSPVPSVATPVPVAAGLGSSLPILPPASLQHHDALHGHEFGGIGIEHLDDTFSTTTEYPSSLARHDSSLILDNMRWHSPSGSHYALSEPEPSPAEGADDGNVFEGSGQNPSMSALQSRLRRAQKGKKPKLLRFASQVEDIGFSSGGSSSSSDSDSSPDPYSPDSVNGSYGSDAARAYFFEDLNDQGDDDWRRKLADTLEVVREFVPKQLIPVDVDERTREVVVKKEWVSGATFVAGLALGKLVWGGGGRGRRVR